jgi:hypothetical protein
VRHGDFLELEPPLQQVNYRPANTNAEFVRSGHPSHPARIAAVASPGTGRVAAATPQHSPRWRHPKRLVHASQRQFIARYHDTVSPTAATEIRHLAVLSAFSSIVGTTGNPPPLVLNARE